MILLILSKIKLKGFCITHIITDLDVVFYFKWTLKRFKVSAVKACYFNFSDCSHKSRICRDPDLIMTPASTGHKGRIFQPVRWPWHLQSSLFDQLNHRKVNLTSFPFSHKSAPKNRTEQICPNIWLMMSISCRTQRAYQFISHLMAFFWSYSVWEEADGWGEPSITEYSVKLFRGTEKKSKP